MALKTKAKIASIGEVLGKKSVEFTFQDPPLIDAPFTTITKLDGSPRQLPDPSKVLKPLLGIERIFPISMIEVPDEKGPNGERVFKPANGDDRIRYVGTNWKNISNTDGSRLHSDTGNTTDYIEITFYGTGLNSLALPGDGSNEFRYILNGGSAQTYYPSNQATILRSRVYDPHVVYPVIDGESLDVHTVRFFKNATGGFTLQSGFEIINDENDQIQVPPGTILSRGSKFTNSALTELSYNSDFDGSPVLNGRGGRVSVYITPEGEVKKAIQQTEASALFMGSADHSNEEVINKINFREFGSNRADDFSSLDFSEGPVDKAFVLDDGTTTLVGSDISELDANNGVNQLYNRANGAFFTLTFVGTGLDVVLGNIAGTIDQQTFLIDGQTVGTISGTKVDGITTVKIASGLPYGTHTFRMRRDAFTNNYTGLSDFIVYGPKKPTIPSDSQEIGDYYLMADYDGSSLTGTAPTDNQENPQGVLRKQNSRERDFRGSGHTALLSVTNNPSGWFIYSTTTGVAQEMTFFGTGFVIRNMGTVTGTYNFTVSVDGVLNDTGVALTNCSNSGGGTYASTTSTGDAPINLEFTGLALGIHTVRIELVTNGRNFGGGHIDVITPVHYPDTGLGSLSMSPGIQLQEETALSGVDLSKAKAWITYDMTSDTIIASHNISAVVALLTGVRHFYFEKPFKNRSYAPIGTTSATGSNTMVTKWNENQKFTNKIEIQTRSSTTGSLINTQVCYAFFGELADEENE